MQVEFRSDPYSIYEVESNEPNSEILYQEDVLSSDLDSIQTVPATPSQFVEFAFYIPEKGQLERFDFSKRPYLRAIYDTPSKRRLVLAGRQVEKTLKTSNYVVLADGCLKEAGNIVVGDSVATMALDGNTMMTGDIIWVSRRYTKPCVRVKTRQGHVVEIALTHPMRLWDRWVTGGDLKVGDRIASVRKCGLFTGSTSMPDERVRITAYLLGDGHFGKQLSFTSSCKKLDEFLADVQAVGGSVTRYKHGKLSEQVRIHSGPIHSWLKEDGLLGHKSASKFIPSWVFGLDKRQTALFLNRLWSTDGHVKQNNASKYSIEYSSISLLLIKQVQALLWKFGVPSKIRENWPNIYKRRGEKKLAYLLRIETQDGVSCFLTEIGAFTKSEGIELPSKSSNNNRDTYPKELNELIGGILASRGSDDWHENRANVSLHLQGLRRTLKYPPTKSKILEYVQFFREHSGFDQKKVDTLESYTHTDLFWDEVVELTDIGPQECVDFEVDGTHNFVAEGLVTHNSTLLGNTCLTYSAMNPHFRTLYVSPSNQQTKVFSRDRVKEPINLSPVLKTFTDSRLLDNVLEKSFSNHSKIILRFAFLNADRVRGLSADLVMIDEFQDIVLDNVPVIEECAFHSYWKMFLYSGTPKSLDNTLEYYWSRFSTQNEWVVPCKRHGFPNKPGSWHWNILDEDNISPSGLICDKCGNPISAADPECCWMALNPNPKVEKPYEGYRLPQIMVPWVDFAEIADKQKKYPRAKFYNEVLGRSYDSGTRPLTRQDIIQNCRDDLSMQYYTQVEELSTHYPIFLGADWGSGENSYTVVSLGGYLPFDPEHFTYFYIKRFEGVEADPRFQIKTIKDLVTRFNVRYIGADYGGGHWPNDELVRSFGAEKVKKYQYVGNVKKKIAFEPRLGVPRYLCHRTEVMSDVMNAIKRANVFRYCRWEEFEDPFGMDFLNIFTEYNERMKMNIYRHAIGMTDDTFHSCLYCFLVSFFYKPRPDVILPTREIDRSEKTQETRDAYEGGEESMDDLDVS